MNKTISKTTTPPEIQAFLERVLHESEIVTRNEQVREKILRDLYEEFERFLLLRIMQALPQDTLETFLTSDINFSDDALTHFLENNISNVQHIFQEAYTDFQKLYTTAVINSRKQHQMLSLRR
jgi:hypothetical protein